MATTPRNSIIQRNTALAYMGERHCLIDHMKVDNFDSMTEVHYHEYFELYILVEGERKFLLSDRAITLKSGDVFIVKDLELHKTINVVNAHYERYCLSLRPKFVKKLLNRFPQFSEIFCTNCFHLSHSALAETVQLIKDIQQEYENENELSNMVVKNKLERMFIIFYKEKLNNKNSYITEKIDIRMQAALEYIDKNFATPIDFKHLADMMYMSESNLSRRFNKTLGINFKTYINTKRIQEACRLLCETDKPIKEISEMVGYDTASYFTLIFRKSIGHSPKEFRNLKIKL